MSSWTPVLPDVLRWRDSCNVYAVLGEERALIVDAGSGEWLAEGLAQLPLPVDALVLTHYFRDHAAGAAAAARAGIPVYVPEGERALLADPAEHFRRRETYVIYDNIWDLFAPVEPVPAAGVLRDYERLALAGVEVQVVPLPGATPTQVGVVLRTPRSGRLVAFCGETIHSPGRVPRLAPLQYNYDDLGGAVSVAFSVEQLRGHRVELLLPSLGEPIGQGVDEALVALHENLLVHSWDREPESAVLGLVGSDRVEQLSPSVWRSTQAAAASHFVVGRSGRALAIDYGYWYPSGSGAFDTGLGYEPIVLPAYPFPGRRRPLLHSLDALREQAGVEQLAAVLTTHYHDDHVCGIPLLQRLYGTPCWAPASFARLLADPAGHRFPCTWPQPIAVERALALDEPLEWDGVRFQFAAMSGHTRFSALIGWEVDGVRYLHAGDQYALLEGKRASAFKAQYVYRNGAFLDSYRASAEWIAAFRPDVVVSGHWAPLRTDAAYFERLADYGREFEQRHRRTMALDDDGAHFGLDSMSGWIWPYRVHLPRPQTVELHADGQPFGQVLEALVTVDDPMMRGKRGEAR